MPGGQPIVDPVPEKYVTPAAIVPVSGLDLVLDLGPAALGLGERV